MNGHCIADDVVVIEMMHEMLTRLVRDSSDVTTGML